MRSRQLAGCEFALILLAALAMLVPVAGAPRATGVAVGLPNNFPNASISDNLLPEKIDLNPTAGAAADGDGGYYIAGLADADTSTLMRLDEDGELLWKAEIGTPSRLNEGA